jgi:hypothetical protein
MGDVIRTRVDRWARPEMVKDSGSGGAVNFLLLVASLLRGEWLVFRDELEDEGLWRNFVVTRRADQFIWDDGLSFWRHAEDGCFLWDHGMRRMARRFPELFNEVHRLMQELHSEPPL